MDNSAPESQEQTVIRYADILPRLGAAAVDFLLLVLILLSAVLLTSIIMQFLDTPATSDVMADGQVYSTQSTGAATPRDILRLRAIITGGGIGFVLFFAYTLFAHLRHARTFGKRMTRTRLARNDGQPPRFAEAILRLLPYIVFAVVAEIIAMSELQQRLNIADGATHFNARLYFGLFLIVWAAANVVCLCIDHKRRMLHDFFADTCVTKDTTTMEFYPSLASIASKYDGFILDLWGVIHDGTHLYPGVKPCLESLRKQGKKIVFLSNAPRRASKVEEKLNELGITPDLYDHVLSSGEVAYQFLAQPENLLHQQNYFYLGPEKDADLLDGLNYLRTRDMAAAEFVLAVDVEFHGQDILELEPYLMEARLHNLPMVCVNPDIEVVKQDGTHIWCAGAIAHQYQYMGGEASYFGKPYAAVYETALALLDTIKRDAILAVGDNIDTDILGANQNGIDSALVTGGILARDMPDPNPYELRELCERKGAIPTFVIPGFTWKKAAA